jgi:FKBP-type peptidyl-prolyl cis-trans isomerase FklB
MNSTKEKVSYCIGLKTGENLRQQFADIDIELLLSGLQDGLSENPPKLPNKEISAVLSSIKSQMEIQQKQHVAKQVEYNKKMGEAFLQENKQKEGVISLPSGLQYSIIKNGEGESPTIFDSVSVQYKGSFIDGTVFDDSSQRDEPTILPVNRVIPGWSEALQLMKPGARWKLFIPHYLAYGEHGFAGVIPPNMTLVFEMEMLSVQRG